MNVSVYRELNNEAKAWWYHKQLRDHNNHSKARKLERRSILSSLDHIRSAGFMTVGRGGWTIHYKDGTLSGYGDGEPYKFILIGRGVPVVDSRPVPDDKIVSVAIGSPLVAISREPDPEPYHGLSYAPISYVAKLYKDAGALVWNIPKED